VFNDIAVAATMALRHFQLDSIMVLDLDVHQGNSTSVCHIWERAWKQNATTSELAVG
jgi:acetoin utilization deacetylase AcuC-like enzyme